MKPKSFFRKVSALLSPIFVLTLSLACDAKDISENIPIEQHENIEIFSKHGMFSVSGWNKNFVNITGQTNDDIQVERKKTTLVLNLNSVDSSTSSDTLEIKIPSNKKISVSSNNANFSFNGLNPRPTETADVDNHQAHKLDPDISVITVDGNVSITNSSGDFNIQTINGDIDISSSKGAANIRTISGHQRVNADFRSVSSSNVSGQSIYKLRTLDKLNLSNVNGTTIVESAVSQGASIQMQSVKGNVELLVPESTSARFSLQSHQGGSIKNTLKGKLDTLSNDTDTQVFALADASASVTINTMDGGISVGYQKAVVSDYDDQSYDWSLVDTNLLNFAFINPNYKIFDYQEIFIKQPEIHFDPSWEEKYGTGEKGHYQQRITLNYANLLKAAIAKTFSQDNRFKIVDQRNENALVIIPKVLELYIEDPETVEIRDVLVAARAGNAKIDLVIFSPSDQSVLALFMDKRSTDRPRGLAIPQARLRNSRAFSQLFNDWTEDIVKVLDK